MTSFGMTNALRTRFADGADVVVLFLASEFMLHQVAGGLGNELGDGDSKHLLAAKNDEVGDPLRRVALL
jgi:hypothetical protein